MMPLASQLISIGYLLLLGAIWGFVWEFLEALALEEENRSPPGCVHAPDLCCSLVHQQQWCPEVLCAH